MMMTTRTYGMDTHPCNLQYKTRHCIVTYIYNTNSKINVDNARVDQPGMDNALSIQSWNYVSGQS